MNRRDSTVQDGLARRALRRFIVETVRALARRHDVSGRSAHEFGKLSQIKWGFSCQRELPRREVIVVCFEWLQHPPRVLAVKRAH
jgi:hypothetical protein